MAITNEEINKTLTKYMGVEWHEFDPDGIKKNSYGHVQCTCGERFYSKNHGLTEHFTKQNPDYLGKDRQELLEWLIKQSWFGYFIDHEYDVTVDVAVTAVFFDFAKPDALGRAIYSYKKGKEDV